MNNTEADIPRWSRKLLRWLLRPEYLEEIEGDLEESFEDTVLSSNICQARKQYNREVIKLIRPNLIKKLIKTQKLQFMTTFIHSYRKFRKKPTFSILNTLGLSLGIFSLLVILTYLYKEAQIDQFHQQSDKLVRLNKHVLNLDGSIEDHPLTSGPMAQALLADYPNVESTVRLLPWFNDEVLQYNETSIKSKRLLFVDKNFFDVFDFELVQGDKSSVFNNNRSIILTESLAGSLISDRSPIGQTIKGFKGSDLLVTGIVKARPDSHIQFDAIMPLDVLNDVGITWLKRWFPQMVYTYAVLNDMSQLPALESDMENFMHKYLPEREDTYKLYFQNFSDIYAHSSQLLYNDKMKSGNHKANQILWAVALVILVLVVINFMNLSSIGRMIDAKGVAIKNLLGASSRAIYGQFILEAFIKLILAVLLATVAIYLVWNRLVLFVGELQFSDLLNPWTTKTVLLLAIVVPILTGFYLLSAKIINKRITPSGTELKMKLGGIRSSLIIFQFLLSSTIITVTFFNYKQLKFISDYDLGYEPESILSLRLDGPNVSKQALAFKNELLGIPSIESISLSRNVPGLGIGTYNVKPEGVSENEDIIAAVFMMGDYDFNQVYNLEMTQGRFFSEDIATDKYGVVINEKLANDLSWSNPIGRHFDIPGEFENGTVIGVVKDFHIKSLHLPVEPMAMIVTERQTKMSLKVTGDNLSETITSIERKWNDFEPNYPVEVLSLSSVTSDMYSKEQRFSKVLTFFSVLAIVIAGLGQIGLMYFLTSSRLKELSIRKVLGASGFSLMRSVAGRFQLLILAGFLLSTPLAWYIIKSQLENYAYGITLSILPFIIIGVVIMVLAGLLSATQTFRASRTNPVDILRSE